MKKMCGFLLLFTLIVLSSCQSGAEHPLRLARIFSDHMVLQERREVPVWGWAAPGANVTVSASWGEEESVTANETGAWMIKIKTTAPGGPYDLKVSSGLQKVELRDVMCGEVWLASGQSLMQWEMYKPFDTKPDIAKSANSQIRLFQVPRRLSVEPQSDLTEGQWRVCDPQSAYDFSACAYYFARQLHDSLREPVGIIQSTWGGTDVERWISAGALAPFSFMKPALQKAEQYSDSFATVEYEEWYDAFNRMDKGVSDGTAQWADPQFDDHSWKSIKLPGKWEKQGQPDLDGIVWFRRSFVLSEDQARHGITIRLGAIDDGDETFVNGQKIGATYDYAALRDYRVTQKVIHAGDNTIAIKVLDHWGEGGVDPYAEMAVISQGDTMDLGGEWKYAVGCDSVPPWPVIVDANSLPSILYNGMVHPIAPFALRGVIWWQSQSQFPDNYGDLFRALINDWRQKWSEPDLPFLFVQNPNAGALSADPNIPGHALVREQQSRGLEENNTFMAVTIDLGRPGNIHFVNKKKTGRRLALLALNHIYLRENVKSDNPVYSAIRPRNDRIWVSFKHDGKKLQTTDGKPPRGFALAGADGRFYWADVKMLNPRLLEIKSPMVSAPKYLRYGFVDNPNVNLINSYGLPVAPFQTQLR